MIGSREMILLARLKRLEVLTPRFEALVPGLKRFARQRALMLT
jgi:hypothetical protein